MRPLEEVLLCLLAHVSPKRGVGFPMALSRACFPKQLGRATAGARIGFGIAPRTQFGIAPRARISKRGLLQRSSLFVFMFYFFK